jgi:hypothetical protein
MNIDKQRIAAVRQLEVLGYRFEGDKWVPASPAAKFADGFLTHR